MAIVGHSYFYHTRSDSVKYIERGSSQHFTSNLLPIIDHLLTADSAIATNIFTPPDIVYLTIADRIYISWRMHNGGKVYFAMAAVVLALVVRNIKWDKGMALVMLGTPLGLLAGAAAANAVAGIMILVGARQAWYVLFVPELMAGSRTSISRYYCLVPQLSSAT